MYEWLNDHLEILYLWWYDMGPTSAELSSVMNESRTFKLVKLLGARVGSGAELFGVT